MLQHSILQLCAISLAFAQINDSQVAVPDHGQELWETNILEAALNGMKGYTVVLKQGGTSQSQCIGVIIDSKTILTSQACTVVLSDENSKSSYNTSENANTSSGVPLATQVLQVNPPMILGSNFVRPQLIDNNEEYESFKNQNGFGIVIPTKGHKLGLVRWYDQMKPGNGGGKSVCEENYAVLRQKHPKWPESLPQGIFCVRGGNQTKDKYVTAIKGKNVTIEGGLPCEDSMGSPIIIPNEGLFGIVTTADCKSDPQVAFAQSLAYVQLPKDESKISHRAATTQPQGANKTTVFSEIGKPPAFYPLPSQYLAPPFIKVIDPTPPSSANHISGHELARNLIWVLGVTEFKRLG